MLTRDLNNSSAVSDDLIETNNSFGVVKWRHITWKFQQKTFHYYADILTRTNMLSSKYKLIYQVTESYDKSYLKWENWDTQLRFGDLSPKQHACYKAEIKRSGAYLQKSSKILEIGFGGGSFLRYAKSKR
jgi:cyclopropane fatty-acyl-phospholipid synthase-like methyltransferase